MRPSWSENADAKIQQTEMEGAVARQTCVHTLLESQMSLMKRDLFLVGVHSAGSQFSH